MLRILLLLIPFFIYTEPFQEGIANASYYNGLRYAHFKSENTSGSVLFIQGRGTFLEFYEVLVNPLLERGYDVWMYDLSGQGGSERLLDDKYMQHVDSFALYVQDAISFIEGVYLPQAQGELILGGYSTGGHVVLRVLQEYPDHPFEKAFVISPLLAMKAPLSNWLMSYLMSFAKQDQYRPGAGPIDPIFTTLFEENGFTTDEESFRMIQQYCLDYPEFMMGGVSMGWVRAAFESLYALWSPDKKIEIPVLIATGGRDTIVDVSYNGDFVKRLPKGVHAYYPDGKHELFRESADIHAALWHDFDLFRNNNL